MAKFDVVLPPGSEKTYQRFHFAPATKVGNTVYCSGVIGTQGSSVPDDAAEEFALAFKGLGEVLEAAGATFGDVVEMTSFHVDMSQHLAAFTAAKDAAISEPYPAWTAIGCTELAFPGARAEIKVTAVLD
ncbi:MAG: RidA family protein [Actinomycetia bacterium]|nr:RidA family protein [Actinomycetes bacterium]MCP4228093.1 RidA family protein [Actinomycetes bacterium]MCP5030779.1 RidA family protein [Actinomycetes bacterium]